MVDICYNYTFTYITLLAIFAIGIALLIIIIMKPEFKKDSVNVDINGVRPNIKTFQEEQKKPIKVSDIFSSIFIGENVSRI